MYNNQEDGFIMNVIDQNLIFYYLEDQKELILIQVYHHKDLLHLIDIVKYI